MLSYQRTVDVSELFILLERLYLFLHSEIEKKNILLGCISDELNVKREIFLVVLLKSLLAECLYVAMNGASFNLLLNDSILSCSLMIWLQLFISLTSATHLA